MGPTGAGKTTFINLASGSQLRVGSGLESETAYIQLSKPFILDKYQIVLIDTPGFDDTTKSEADVLRGIAEYLATMHTRKQYLHGIIYLHRITDNRMGGTALRNFRMFRELCGGDALANCAVVLNMWNEVSDDIRRAREKELRETDVFFKPAIDAGTLMMHHEGGAPSARAILSQIAQNNPRPFLIQREIVDMGKPISETSAGLVLLGDLAAKHLKQLAQLHEMEAELEEAVRQKDEKEQRELEEIQLKTKRERDRLEEEQRRIRDAPAVATEVPLRTVGPLQTIVTKVWRAWRALRERV
ncbi:hypothetical protein POSPLADRAFT_1044118 [Postia placenta MAD-698-R-SB12]|uniref:G domain-containing protein n=1 Tax=Postia placenta MAD-698-R-SB12 TaxID=670580 RepID=A0A1X6N809_9APHY|nr:hypothetical protein POSPLADRAFT_1044118 [Postia placenta MAD-698-R-SB12]OSX64606.1 hypothetical protein POSPLADRAFT_1044118 [Postia placenta MAD-698-R-SB12]